MISGWLAPMEPGRGGSLHTRARSEALTLHLTASISPSPPAMTATLTSRANRGAGCLCLCTQYGGRWLRLFQALFLPARRPARTPSSIGRSTSSSRPWPRTRRPRLPNVLRSPCGSGPVRTFAPSEGIHQSPGGSDDVIGARAADCRRNRLHRYRTPWSCGSTGPDHPCRFATEGVDSSTSRGIGCHHRPCNTMTTGRRGCRKPGPGRGTGRSPHTRHKSAQVSGPKPSNCTA